MKDFEYFTNFLFGPNRNLNQIIRFNTRQRSYDETVAAHVYFVSLYSLILADIAISNGQSVDVEKVLRYALLHDMEESSSGDIIRTFKVKMKEAYKKLSLIAVNRILHKLPSQIKLRYVDTWAIMEEHHQGRDIEIQIVNIADELAGIVYCIENECMGNKYFKTIRENYFKNLQAAVKNTPFEMLPKEIEKYISKSNICCYD